jgi:hypothetical protein
MYPAREKARQGAASIPCGFGRWARFRTRAEIDAVRHRNTVFHQVLKHLWDRFGGLLERYRADARIQRPSTKGRFLSLPWGQLSGAASAARKR